LGVAVKHMEKGTVGPGRQVMYIGSR